MSTLMMLIRGAMRSNTIQFNSIAAAILMAIKDSELIQSNPEYATIFSAVVIVANWLLRFKTTTPILDR